MSNDQRDQDPETAQGDPSYSALVAPEADDDLSAALRRVAGAAVIAERVAAGLVRIELKVDANHALLIASCSDLKISIDDLLGKIKVRDQAVADAEAWWRKFLASELGKVVAWILATATLFITAYAGAKFGTGG
jgi:hypothetical protein